MVTHDTAMPTADAMRNRRPDPHWYRCALSVLMLHSQRPKHHREYRQPDKRNRDQRSDATASPPPARVIDM